MPGKRTPAKPQRPQPPQAPQAREGFVAVGFVRAPRGILGELSVEPMTDFAERFQPGAAVWAAGVSYTIARARPHRNALLIQFEGIESRDQAEPLRGLLLEVPDVTLTPLEQGRYYRFQIVGMDVVDTEGASLGRIQEVLETGANDVYIVHDAESELLIPAIDTVIQDVDIDANRMVVRLLDKMERRPLKTKTKR